MDNRINYVLKKGLISGFKLGESFWGFNYVAVPKQEIKNKQGKNILVIYADDGMLIPFGKAPVTEETFPDKFTKGKFYTLYYYVWAPTKHRKKQVIATSNEKAPADLLQREMAMLPVNMG